MHKVGCRPVCKLNTIIQNDNGKKYNGTYLCVIPDKIDNNIHLKRPSIFTSQILLFRLNNASPWCSGVWLRNNASRCFVSGVRIFSFVSGSLSQTGMLLPTFFGRTYDRKLSIIWLVISCFICLVCWGPKVFPMSTQLSISKLHHKWSQRFMVTHN